jgi:hypothetical protein
MSWSKGRSRTIRKEILFSPEEWEQVKEDMDSVSTNFRITWTQYIRGLLWHEKFYQIVLPINVEHTNKVLDSIEDDVNRAYLRIQEPDTDVEEQIHEMATAIGRMNTIIQECKEYYPEFKDTLPTKRRGRKPPTGD